MLIPKHVNEMVTELSTSIADLEWQLKFEENKDKQLEIYKQLVSLMAERDFLKCEIILDLQDELMDTLTN